MWVQPSLGVLAFIWENEDDGARCLHPFKTEENPKEARVGDGKSCCQGAGNGDRAPNICCRGVTLSGHLVVESYPASLPSCRVSCYALLLSLWDVQACYTSNRSEPLWFVFPDMKIALGFIGVFLSVLLGECVVTATSWDPDPCIYRYKQVITGYYCLKDLWSERSFCLF